jgi:pilus assembly protein Flp/PilA
MHLIKRIALRLRLETGATMVEYGLMVALIAVVALAAATALGVNVAAKFQQIANAL